MRRHDHQEVTINAMVKEKSLVKGLSIIKAHDILWALNGRDLYRMLVIEQNWKSDDYEKWLTQMLIRSLVQGE